MLSRDCLPQGEELLVKWRSCHPFSEALRIK